MNLAEHFLIATPSLRDPMFEHSVVLIGEHQESGAMGIVINKPSPVHMEVVFAAIGQNTPARFAGQYVMMGGPVQTERGFVLHTPVGNWESSLHINEELALTTSRDDHRRLNQRQGNRPCTADHWLFQLEKRAARTRNRPKRLASCASRSRHLIPHTSRRGLPSSRCTNWACVWKT